MYRNIDIICNPSSGKQKFQQNIQDIKKMLENEGRKVKIFYTEKKYDGKNYTIESCKGTTDLIISVGGDGTLNEVVNGLMESERKIPLAIYPTGTVNDFASFFEISTKVQDFYRMIQHGREKWVDAGKANDHYFINVAAGGKITEVAHKVSSDSKTILGRMAYILEGARDFPREIFKPVQLKLSVDGEMVEREVLFFLVSNTQFVGGFKQLMNRAKIDDGKLDLLMVEKLPVKDFFNIFVKAFNGSHIDHPKVYYKYVEEVTIMAEPAMEIDVDGEYLGNTPAQISVIKKAVKILVP
ncbi:diacylglycerol/lipid kinase family protein [Isachenkonia alkalipeptolytica]|uniref:Diacylglycerol kinase family lipid kinase n=1 Tax=Isachenkonia alkalipeptolytica TaxID=2565777 RepID=A0AA43XJC2_9CLOT|nr:diacylglycerol kinase family protein [Isachenkonia alkalipeptolytica]NBG87908.1 diacylglycerol kinase family lipid kinase [Isachenkonia alkalipeptolytica]